jgi:hypothetical protein
MDIASVTVQLVPKDLERFSRQVARQSDAGWRGWVMLVAVVFLVLVQTCVVHFREDRVKRRGGVLEESPASGKESKLLGAVPYAFVGVFVVALLYFQRQARKPAAYERYTPGIFARNTYEVLERGLLCRSDRGETLNCWPVITRLIETEEDIYVMLAANYGHVLPKRCFPTLEAMAIFRNQLQLHLDKHAPAALQPARRLEMLEQT